MRSYVRLMMVASVVLLACGGGTPAPKDESEAAEHESSKSADSPKAPSSTAASEPASPAPSAKPSPGDLVAPTADDPWMAAHQMPAKDVLRTMQVAKGKVNACWNAAKKRDPSVSGEVKIKFVVTHEGAVRVWRNEDSTCGDEDAINCVGEVIKSSKFPTQKSPGDAWGIYQINFGG
jgi:hypothetical protein